MEDSVRVGKASDLADGDMMLAEVGEEHVLVCRLGGNYFAAGDGCPHAGGSLSDGYLEGEEVECPLHGSLFSVRTGDNTGPPATEGVPTYQVTVDGDDLMVGPASP